MRQNAGAHRYEATSVSLAWLLAKGVTAPIASARTIDQLDALLAAPDLVLSSDEVCALDEVSAVFAPKSQCDFFRPACHARCHRTTWGFWADPTPPGSLWGNKGCDSCLTSHLCLTDVPLIRFAL
ncbi:aldo/keto reductase [Staphylococcus aureus]|uniref:aldo/keto reductase n=1 Tax=Staphylococcus aureus TaxID=1280 RepID=UPI001C12AFD1